MLCPAQFGLPESEIKSLHVQAPLQRRADKCKATRSPPVGQEGASAADVCARVRQTQPLFVAIILPVHPNEAGSGG